MYRTELTKRLDYFWGSVSQPGARRLEWLKNAADWHISSDRRYIDVRRGSRRFPSATGSCWCCQVKRATLWHHIIQIQHGGRNKARNRVPLCRLCHRKIHPWIEARSERAVGALQAACDTTPRLVRK